MPFARSGPAGARRRECHRRQRRGRRELATAARLSAADCDALLRALVQALAPSGLLIFSTQGATCLDHLEWHGDAFDRLETTHRSALVTDGSCFVPYPGRVDYGVTLHARTYLEQTMHRLFGSRLELIRFVERGWDDHQDVWTYRVTEPNPT